MIVDTPDLIGEVKARLAELRDTDDALICASMALQMAMLYANTKQRERLQPALNITLTERNNSLERQT